MHVDIHVVKALRILATKLYDPVLTDVHALRAHANVKAGLRQYVQLEMTCGHLIERHVVHIQAPGCRAALP
eukprot:7811704-Alexandrium_andersonii.AAC.1